MQTLIFATGIHNINGHGPTQMHKDINFCHGPTQMHTDIQSEHKSSKYREAMTPFCRACRSAKNVCVDLCVSVANKIKRTAMETRRYIQNFYREAMTVFILSTAAGRA